MLPQFYQTHLATRLNSCQLLTLQLLVGLLQFHKQVRIERLAALFPQPILYESRRRYLQRFLKLPQLSVASLWLPIIEHLIKTHFSKDKRLFVSLDRTQWKDYNLFVVSVIWAKRAWPIYWNFLDKRGCSNLTEQQALLRPVIRMLKSYNYVVVGDREFHSVELAKWLQSKNVAFAFRQKADTYIQVKGEDFQQLNSLDLSPGMRRFLTGVKVTKSKGFGKVAIAYTITALQGLKIKQLGQQKYINRLQELGRVSKRHSNFWIGQYGLLWIAGMEIWADLAQQLMRTKCNKLPFFHRGQRAMMLIQSIF